uniref:Protein DBF4 homolog A n=1 Tax=Aotus nancymaae TaxID=37293 RepID=A0A2K5DU90_AOTNA
MPWYWCIKKPRTGRLKKPFVKVEDISQLCRPFYLQLINMPFVNYSIQKPCSPFDVEKPLSRQKQTQIKLRIQMDGDKYEKKKGYCECCLQKYEDIETHLLSKKHRNIAQSNQYQVVDDIVSKLVFDFVECEKDTPKKKRIKYNVESLSPVSANALKKTEQKEKVELQYISQKDCRKDDIRVMEQNFLYKDTQETEKKLVCISEGLNEKTTNKCSMLNTAENDIRQNFIHLPLHKNKQECILDISEHTLNENDLELLRVDHHCCNIQASVHVFDFNTDNSESQPKQKSDTVRFPVKDLKEKDLHSVFAHDSGLITINSSQGHLTVQAKAPSHTSELVEKSELGFTSYTENSGICNVLDIWEEENSNNLLTMFFSSPSTSTFTGF